MARISEDIKRRAKDLVRQMTLEEKAGLHSGQHCWHTKKIERLGLGQILMTDGPHGMRKEIDENQPISIENTVPATCFPAAVSTSCSFDTELLYEMGVAMAEECLEEEVAIILGPAANIKRSPLCGRNFEYISEDPYLAGNIAKSLINGIQSKNVGASLKHFIANNQETGRHTSNSIIDERTMREIYLTAFEIAVKESQPFSVMCSYNRTNGIYGSNQKRMLSKILKEEWNFDGFVVTDWGAMDDRAKSVEAGLDLEMPGRSEDFDLDIVDAVNSGKLDVKLLDECIERLVAVILQTIENKKEKYNRDKHDTLARKIARESAVLLRNENNVLPIKKEVKVALIGEFAESPRYQGAGSSLIRSHKITGICDEFKKQNINYIYCKGYDKSTDKPNEQLINEAINASADCDVILVAVGLPDIYESEGYDREHISMPLAHNLLVEKLSELGKPVVAVIMTGSAVEIPWKDKVDGILLMNLAGQNVGGAVYDLIFGDYSPCGKLAETYPLKLSDTPSFNYFGSTHNVEYREGVFVGYRYYDTAKREVAYPFGFGLSYSAFEYSNIKLSKSRIKDTDKLTVSVSVKNIGKIKAKEIVELYVKAPESSIFRPAHELKGFAKIELMPGETKTVEMQLSKRAFAYYNTKINDWHVISGNYTIQIGSSSRDIRLEDSVYVESTNNAQLPDYYSIVPAYYNLSKCGEFTIPFEQYSNLFADKSVFAEKTIKPFNENSTLNELMTDSIGKDLAERIIKKRLKQRNLTKLHEEYYNAPLRSSMFPYHPMTRNSLRGLILWANGNIDEAKKLLGENPFEC